jgi:hypothetical protein
MDCFAGFAWAVPRAFADPLERCRFERGDILYDSPKAYDGDWKSARKAARRIVQVRLPKQGDSGKQDKDAASVFSDNWRRDAEIDLIETRDMSCREIATTQGRLYTFLWRGDEGVLDLESPEPPVPLTARDLRNDIDTAAPRIAAEIDAPAGGRLFVVLFDHASSLSRKKDRDIRMALDAHPGCEVHEVELATETALPTLRWLVYRIPDLDDDGVTELLKPALYRPQGDRQGKTDRFDLKRHGRLIDLDRQGGLF